MQLKSLKAILLAAALLIAARISGQETTLFMPFVKDHTRSDYAAGLQNRDIVQDGRGVMYFANNEGMLVFLGNKWRLYPLPNKTVVRSLAIDQEGIIYAGGQNEFGFFSPDGSGDWEFHSLRDRVPEKHRVFNDVWDAEANEEGAFFRASGKIFRFVRDTIQVFEYEESVTALLNDRGHIYIQVKGQGIFLFQQGAFVRINELDPLKRKVVTSILPFGPDQMVISTLNQGLFIWSEKESSLSSWEASPNAYLADNLILCASPLAHNRIALGTGLDGLVVLDTSGQIVQHLSSRHGLLNNTVNALEVDSHNHLWLALESGLNYLLTNSPFFSLRPDNGIEGIPYTSMLWDEKLYIGTSNGLYSSAWTSGGHAPDENQFSLVENSQGQVWSLQDVDGDLLIGHHEGGYLLHSNGAVRISKSRGGWLFQVRTGTDHEMLGGAYDGLHIYQKDADSWQWMRRLEDFELSSRFVVQENANTVWVSHPYKGVFRIRYGDEHGSSLVEKMDTTDGLPSEFRTHVFRIGGEVIFCAQEGVYDFDNEHQRFQRHEVYQRFFDPKEKVRRLFESPGGNIWFVTEKEIGVLQVDEKSLHKEIHKKVFPELRGKLIGGYEFIYPASDRHVLFATEDGFILYDASLEIAGDSCLSVILDEVRAAGKGDSLLFMGVFHKSGRITPTQVKAQIPSLPPYLSTIQFSFSAPDYAYPELVEYRYKLDGLDENWSEWTRKSGKEYSNLKPGNYIFRILARNFNGYVSDETEYAFTINPPWYAAPMAYWIYGIAAITLIGGMFWLPRRKFEQEKDRMHSERKRLIDEHEKAIEESEQEKIRLQNEKLMLQLEHKNRELVSAALNVVEKKDILQDIAQDLSKIHKSCPDPQTKKKIGSILNKFDHEKQFDDDWEQFVYHFEQVHEDFFHRLRDKHPNLTSRDHKLCAYLRMNLSTKEIASILNITVRSAEVSRYRLRKKLGLESNEKLDEYLSHL